MRSVRNSTSRTNGRGLWISEAPPVRPFDLLPVFSLTGHRLKLLHTRLTPEMTAVRVMLFTLPGAAG